ncbi:hypothetical protein [Candidatus Roseilinea sp. NK_OTU-006]|jgi:uncharacterized membrane protein|uniref:hypothetical protein n=1 Tax=Candidatus Roseilinea sp. NK_OTU-006 TaxID=2704250 RepID=UPI00145D56B1|nr:hypothetical protein [Candidatus Roseilinea sp. NK_OTU-006]
MSRRIWLPLLWLAFALRLWNIERYDLWYDEVGQVLAALKPTPAQTLDVVRKHYGASPLAYLSTFATARLGGTSELVLRFDPLFWSMLAVALVWRAGRALHPAAGMWAGLLAAISPSAIRYAQEVRFYALGLAGASAIFCLSVLIARGELRRMSLTWAALAGATALTLYGHVYSVLVVLPAFVTAVGLTRPAQRLQLSAWLMTAMMCGGLLFLPWFLAGLKVAQHPFGAQFSSDRVWYSILAGLELAPAFRASAIAPGQDTFATVMMALSGLAAIYAVLHMRRAPWVIALLLGIGLAIVAVVALNARVGYFFHPRQFLFLQPARLVLVGVLLGALLSLLRSRVLRLALSGALMGGLVLSSIVYINADLHRVERARLRPVAQTIAAHARTKPALLFIAPFWVYLGPEYYLQKEGVQTVWQRLPGDQVTPEALASLPDGALLLVPRNRADLDALLSAHGLRLLSAPTDVSPEFYVWLKDQAGDEL